MVSKASRFTAKPSGGWMSIPGLLLIGAVILMPVGVLLVRSVLEPEVGLGNYTELAQDETTQTVLLRTFRTSFVITLITLALAYPYAYTMARVGGRMRAVMVALVLLPYWTSLMARTFAWLILLQEGGFVQSTLAFIGLDVRLAGTNLGMTIGMVQMLLPFMVLPLYSTMRGIDGKLLAAARSLGANKMRAFWRVYAPLSAPGVAGGSILVFILALGFYVTPRILGSPQQAMIAELIVTRVDQLLDFGGAGAIALVALVVTMLLLLLMSRVINPSKALGLTNDE
jgi:putative spermidine/putrescine transport system permease protein